MADVAETIFSLLEERGAEKSICPSEVARALWPTHWRAHMEAVREEARRLTRVGRLRVTQGATVLDPDVAWTGPIRLRLPTD